MSANKNHEVNLRELLLLVVFTIWSESAVQWYFLVPFTTIFGLALFYPSLLLSWLFWIVITLIHVFALGQIWYWEGNGLFLFLYTSLLITLALASPKPTDVLRINSRYIIGLIFVLATFWKVTSADFLSSDFMQYYLVTDARISPIAVALTPLERSDVLENQVQLSLLPDETAQLTSPKEVRSLAVALTYLTLLVEATVALVFLLAHNEKIRNWVLAVFLVSCYSVITVPPFAMILACLGFAQTSSFKFKTFYKIFCILVPLTTIRYFISV